MDLIPDDPSEPLGFESFSSCLPRYSLKEKLRIIGLSSIIIGILLERLVGKGIFELVVLLNPILQYKMEMYNKQIRVDW